MNPEIEPGRPSIAGRSESDSLASHWPEFAAFQERLRLLKVGISTETACVITCWAGSSVGSWPISLERRAQYCTLPQAREAYDGCECVAVYRPSATFRLDQLVANDFDESYGRGLSPVYIHPDLCGEITEL